MLTKENLKQAMVKSYPHYREVVIDQMIENRVEDVYGSEDNYQKALQNFQQDEAANQVDLDTEGFRKLQESFEEGEREILNPEALRLYEIRKLALTHSGLPEEFAALQARLMIEQEFPDTLFDEPAEENPLVERQIERLEEIGFKMTPKQRRDIKIAMALHDTNAPEALLLAGIQENFESAKYNNLSEEEREFFDILPPTDRRIVDGLRAVQPDSKWSYAKFYHQQYGPKPRKASEKPEEKVEEATVPVEKYKWEIERVTKLKSQLAKSLGIPLEEVDTYLVNRGVS